jgi:hypothetical protein
LSVVIVESRSAGHFLDVRSRVEVITIQKWEVMTIGNHLTNGGFTTARDSHDDEANRHAIIG